ncbi:ATP-dependent helicase, partial [Streptomyces sp. NPDC006743]
PHITPIHAGDTELHRITGARTPPGTPTTITEPKREGPRGASSPARGRRGSRGRAGQGRPAGEAARRSAPRRAGSGSAA